MFPITDLLANPLALSVSTAAPNNIVQMSQRERAKENLSPGTRDVNMISYRLRFTVHRALSDFLIRYTHVTQLANHFVDQSKLYIFVSNLMLRTKQTLPCTEL